MQITIKGLKTINTEKAEAFIADFHPGDILAYGIKGELLRLHEGVDEKEAAALSNLIAGLLATSCGFGFAQCYVRFVLAVTERELEPEIENTLFEEDDTIYVTLAMDTVPLD